MSGEQEHHICLYRFSFHKLIKLRLVRGRLYLPSQRYELHHRICNLRYVTHGYGVSIKEVG